MKLKSIKFFIFATIGILLFPTCGGKKNIILKPDPIRDMFEHSGPKEIWELIETQNGPLEKAIPEWVSLYLNESISGTKSLEENNNKYFFIVANHGIILTALKHWANGFSEEWDFPGLLVQRVEQRLVSTASLYPDDEYGEFFENMIKQVSDGDYPGVVKEQIFWIKQKQIPPDDEDEDNPPELSSYFIPERYKIFLLLSIDKEALQKQIRQIMSEIRTQRSQTRDHTAAINRIRNTFFEGF